MLSDFDLSKQSDPNGQGGAPAGIRMMSASGVPLVDTRSCIADFRTNSFVGTEGERVSLSFLKQNVDTIAFNAQQSTFAQRLSTAEVTALPSTGEFPLFPPIT